MKIRGTNNIEKLGIGIMYGGFVLSLGLGISACVLYGHFLRFTPSIIALLSASCAAPVLSGGIGITVVKKADDLENKESKAIRRVKTLFSKGENL